MRNPHALQLPAAAPASVLSRPTPAHGAAAPLEVLWARDEADLRSAQRLRHQVFADEMGAHLTPPHGTPAGHDVDVFDTYCEHLLVRAQPDADEAPIVVGTYRVMTPAAARRAGGF